MRKALAITVLTLFSLAPALGSACEYEAATSASAAPPAQLASTEAPAASRAPSPSALKAPAPRTTAKQQTADKTKAPARDVKIAGLTSN